MLNLIINLSDDFRYIARHGINLKSLIKMRILNKALLFLS